MLCLTSALLLALPPVLQTAPEAPVVVIRGATLYDGSGKPGQVGDLVIRDERIAAIGAAKVGGKVRVIDGKGLIVAPGFIDLHTHSDSALTKATTRNNLNYLRQGVTTVITGNCGFGPEDVAGYFKALRSKGIGSNVIHLVPHNAVRRRAMGNANRPPSDAELKKMEEIVDRGMRDGAWGLSTGLIYNPGTYARTDELVALAKVVSRHRGLYASHIRNEGTAVVAATQEALTIGRRAGLPVHISHMKASGANAWGKAADQIALVLAARKSGQAVSADQYPYVASSTSLLAMVVPARFREGSEKDFLARLDDPEQGPRVRAGIEAGIKARRGGRSLRIAAYKPRPEWQGKSLDVIARAANRKPVDVVVEMLRHGGAGVVSFGMSEEDVRLIMKQDFVATASDGTAQVPAATVPHPRSYGCFPRKIGHYALKEGVITLEHALRSASGLPADILKLKERGYLKPGSFADVVVFDPKRFRDTATYDKPHQYAPGVRYLFVNGRCVIDDGKFSGALAGKVLTHKENSVP
jgi:N-acyl-D-aspartate/D-glutamate deacylase